MKKLTHFDVIVIGGSYAGLSAAMALGRSLRSVLIMDSGLPCNRQTPHSHNFLTQDGSTPQEIAAIAKSKVMKYSTIQFYEGLAIRGKHISGGFEITTSNEDAFTAKKLVFATGVKDEIPNIKGFAACWGISVVHCPYCHGYEFRNQKTGIMVNGEKALHITSLVQNLTNDITILPSGKADFSSEQVEKLNKHNIRIVEKEISEMEHDRGHIKNVVFKDGSKMNFKVVYAAVPYKQHTDIPIAMGCELTEQGLIKVDHFQKTTIEGIFACGDNSSTTRSVATAVYSGNITGAMVNNELTQENF